MVPVLIFTIGLVSCGVATPTRDQPGATRGPSTSGGVVSQSLQPSANSKPTGAAANLQDYVLQHSGKQRCTGVHDEEYFLPPLTLQTVLNWADFVVVGTVIDQSPAKLAALPGVAGTLNSFSVEKVIRSRGRIPVPSVVPWFSFSEITTAGTFNCAEHDPAPIAGAKYLVFFYEVGGDFSAVRGASATAALAIDDRLVLHAIAETVTKGKSEPFGASRSLDGLSLDAASKLVLGMTQGPDPLKQVRADTSRAGASRPPLTVRRSPR